MELWSSFILALKRKQYNFNSRINKHTKEINPHAFNLQYKLWTNIDLP